MSSTPEEYAAKAASALEELSKATNETDRKRLRTAHAAYLRLSTHQAEGAARAAVRPKPAIKPEKPKQPAAAPRYFDNR